MHIRGGGVPWCFSPLCTTGVVYKKYIVHCVLLGYRHTYKRMCPGAFLHSVLLMYRDTSKRRGDVPGCFSPLCTTEVPAYI